MLEKKKRKKPKKKTRSLTSKLQPNSSSPPVIGCWAAVYHRESNSSTLSFHLTTASFGHLWASNNVLHPLIISNLKLIYFSRPNLNAYDFPRYLSGSPRWSPLMHPPGTEHVPTSHHLYRESKQAHSWLTNRAAIFNRRYHTTK